MCHLPSDQGFWGVRKLGKKSFVASKSARENIFEFYYKNPLKPLVGDGGPWDSANVRKRKMKRITSIN